MNDADGRACYTLLGDEHQGTFVEKNMNDGQPDRSISLVIYKKIMSIHL